MGSSSRMVVEEAENWGAGEGGAHNDGGAKWATLLPDSHPSQVLAVLRALRDETPHLKHNNLRGPHTPFMQEEARALRHGGPKVGRAELSPQPSAHPARPLHPAAPPGPQPGSSPSSHLAAASPRPG